MSTKMKPSELAGLDLVKYKKILEKDFARTSKKKLFIDYVFVQDYKFKGKKSNLLLFADAGDDLWTAAIEAAKENGKKNAIGKCKVLKGEEDAGITLVIKTAKGTLNKTKVAEVINEEMFKDDFGVEAIVIGDDDDFSDENLLKQKERTVGDSTLKSSEEFKQDATLKDKVGKETKMTAFVDTLEAFFKKVGSLEELGEEVKRRLLKIQTLHTTHESTPKYKAEVLPTAQKAVSYLGDLVVQLEDVIEKGNYWLKENGELFAEALRSKEKVARHDKKVKETTQQIAQAQKIMRQLIQTQDNILEKYLKDYSGSEGIHETLLQNQNELYKNIVGAYKKYTEYRDDQYDLRIQELDSLDQWTVNWNRGSYKSEKHQDIVTKIIKKITDDREDVEKGLSTLLEDNEAFKGVCKAHKALFKIKGDTLDKQEERKVLLDKIYNKLTELDSSESAAITLKDTTYKQLVEVKRIVEQMTADKAIVDLIEVAQKKGELNADNLFDAFMKKYRGNVAYTPESGGTVLDGCSNANCQDLTGAFIRVLKDAGLVGSSIHILGSYFITAPVDAKWIDPSAGGNINFVGKDEKRYFFADHWVIDYNGTKYCPTTGRKGGEVSNTVWKTPGNVALGKGLKVDGYKFYNLKGKEAKNENKTYRLEEGK